MPNIIEGVGARLRSERRRLGLTQDEFASAAGITRTSVGFIERGSNLPNTGYLASWANIGVDLPYVLFGTLAGTPVLDIEMLDGEILEKCFDHVEELEHELGEQLSNKARASIFRMVLGAYLKGTKGMPQIGETKKWIAK